jgi:hypothetical protein
MKKRGTGLLAGGLTAALLAIGAATAASAPAAVVTVAPASTPDTNSFPFGRGDNWGAHMGFAYKNIPAFTLKTGDTLAFDLVAANDVPQQMDISMSATTLNGTDIPAGAFTTIVPNTVAPTGTGNTVKGDYDLGYRVATPFTFAGGGLVIRFANPTPAFDADTSSTQVMQDNLTNSLDASGFFVSRFMQDADGAFPWSVPSTDNIAGFRLNIADPVAPLKKKCTKKKKKKAKKSAAETAKKKKGKKKCKSKKKKGKSKK